MIKSPKVAIITLNWNGKKWIDLCLTSLLNLNYDNFQILMVDNNSTDGSYEHVISKYSDIEVIRNDTNLGYSKGFNKGINLAMKQKYDYILLVNNDTAIGHNALKNLVETAESDEKIGFVTGKVMFLFDRKTIQTAGRENDDLRLVGNHIGAGIEDQGQFNGIKDFDFVDDIFLLVKSDVVKKVGGYDEDFFLQFEEADWCCRVKRAGFRIVYNSKAMIWHGGSLSSGGDVNSTYAFFRPKNIIIFMKKNSTPSHFFRFILNYLFIQSPKNCMSYIVKRKTGLVLTHLKGIIQGYRYSIAN